MFCFLLLPRKLFYRLEKYFDELWISCWKFQFSQVGNFSSRLNTFAVTAIYGYLVFLADWWDIDKPFASWSARSAFDINWVFVFHLQVGRCKPYNLLQWSSNIPRSTQTSITNKSYQCNLISRPAKTSITNRSFQLQQWTDNFLLQFYEMLQQKSFHKRQVSAFWAPCVYLGSFCEDYLGNIWRLFDIY